MNMYLDNTSIASTRFVNDQPLAALIVHADSAFDSVELQSLRRFPGDFVREMKRHCGSIWYPKSFKPFEGCTMYRMWLHQPRRAAIEALSGHVCYITKVQVNLDLLTRSRQDAQHLHSIITRHLRTNSKATELSVQYENTTYFNFGRTHGPRKNLLAYSDRHSKIAPEWSCTHVELRIAGSKLLDASGIRYQDGLLNLDHRAFWEENIKLVDIPSAEEMGITWCRHFEKTRNGKSRRFPYGTRANSIRRIGHSFERMAAIDDSGYLRAHDLEHTLSSYNVFDGKVPSHLFRSVRVESMLPGSENGLWRTS